MSKTITRVNYNFTEEQQEKFTLYYAYVKENYKSLLDDDIMREKTKNMLAIWARLALLVSMLLGIN